MKPVTVEVWGNTMFPFDMLRYDGAYPANPDASSLLDAIAQEGGHTPKYIRDTRMRLICTRPPTPARWASFGWACEIRE